MDETPHDPRRLIARLAVAIMVADGRITASERDALDQFDRLGLGPLSVFAEEEIRRAVNHPIDVRGTCAALASISPEAAAVILAALAELAAAGGSLAPRELAVLEGIAEAMGLTPAELSRVLSSAIGMTVPTMPLPTRVGVADGGRPGGSGPRADPAPATGDESAVGLGARGPEGEVALALRTLGLADDADDADLEAAYRDLVERYNPVKVIDLGTEFAALAVRKLTEVTTAYERVRALLERQCA